MIALAFQSALAHCGCHPDEKRYSADIQMRGYQTLLLNGKNLFAAICLWSGSLEELPDHHSSPALTCGAKSDQPPSLLPKTLFVVI